MASKPFVRLVPERPSWRISLSDITGRSANPIGRGGFGEVFTGTYFGSKVAIKQLLGNYNNRELADYNYEISIWKQLSHPNILPLLGTCDQDDDGNPISPFMVSPFMPNGTLLNHVSDANDHVPLDEKLRLLYQVASGMAYLHGRRIIHGDLKAANVLLDGLNNAVVTDFGMSRTKHTSASMGHTRNNGPTGGTEGYMAPEMLDDDDPSDTTMKTDVYAFAITVYEVLNDAKPVWATASGQAMKPFQILVQLLQHKRPKRIGDIPDNVWALIERCWAHDPADRPSFPDILDVLQPYNRAPVPQSSSIAAPSRAISDTAVPDVNSRSQPSRSGELWFDGIDSVVRLPGLLVAHAKQGDPEACLDAAKFISDGLLARHSDWKLAAQLFKAAADRGNLEACFSLAWLHLTGEGIHQDDRSALWYWQEVSTKSGDQAIKSIATHMVGWMHYLGRGTIRDEQKGISIIRYNESKAFPLGEHDGLATYRLTSDDSLASRKFFGLCQSGSGQDWLCKHLMAVCLVQGFGTPKDQRRAFGLLEELAGRGHSDSQFWVGECCFWGRGVPWNYSRAFEWLSKSADQGNSYGQWMLGRFYASGWGVDEDKPKGAGWFRRSAERGNRYGQYELGHCYNRGSGVAQSIDTAAFWFRKSADQGFDAAANSLKDIGK